MRKPVQYTVPMFSVSVRSGVLRIVSKPPTELRGFVNSIGFAALELVWKQLVTY